MKYSNMNIFKRLLIYIKQYFLWALLSVLSLISATILSIAIAKFIQEIIDTSMGLNWNRFIFNTFILLGLLIMNFPIEYLSRYSSAYITSHTINNIRHDVGMKIANLNMSYLDKNHSGDIISRLTNDIGVLQNFLQWDLPQLFFQPLLFLFTLIYLLIMNWKLTLFSLILVPLFMYLTQIITKPISKYSNQLQEQVGKINVAFKDALGGINLLKAFNLKQYFDGEFKKNNDIAVKRGIKVSNTQAAVYSLAFFLSILPGVCCIAYGGYLVIKAQITIGSLIAFTTLLNNITQPLNNIPGLISSMKSTMGTATRVFEILDQPDETTNEQKSDVSYDNMPIVFENVNFSYDGADNVLKGINFTVKPNRITAIVGESGSGKSTIAELICRFYDVSDGKISVYGNDLNTMNKEMLRSLISIVSQNEYLFPVSVEENIRYGNIQSTEEEVINASKFAYAHDFITKLHDGYKTQVGEKGLQLSGGQRQRIAIARAVLKNAPIFIFDEATAALDNESESNIKKTMENLAKNHTILVISHRLSSIKDASHIIVIDKGQIVESGTHEQLINNDGIYRLLFMKQVDSKNEENRLLEEGAQ